MQAPLRIGLILQGGSGWVGGTEYSKNLIKALYRLPAEVQATFELIHLCRAPLEQALYQDMPARFFRELSPNVPPGRPSFVDRFRQLIAQKLHGQDTLPLLQRARELGIHFLYPHLPSPWDGPEVRSATWIPDFQHKYYPELFSRRERWGRDRVFALAARNAARVVLSSQTAKHDFDRLFPAAAVKSTVLAFRTVPHDDWLAPDPVHVQRKYNLPDRFFIVCNQFWQHKNHRLVFEALRILRQGSTCPTIVCTGKLSDYRRQAFVDECLRLLAENDIAGQVRLLGLIPRHDQVQLMRRSLAVIQPSLFEGWSTVVEDARALGKPTALSDIPVHREQNPPGAVFVDPHTPLALASLLRNWWDSLHPGPQEDQEAAAIQTNQEEVQWFGKCFLDLARTAPAQKGRRSA